MGVKLAAEWKKKAGEQSCWFREYPGSVSVVQELRARSDLCVKAGACGDLCVSCRTPTGPSSRG